MAGGDSRVRRRRRTRPGTSARDRSQPLRAFAIEDQQWGEQLHIAVTGLRAPAESAISEHLAHEFGATAKPKGILYLEEFPLRGICKIDHSALAKIQRAKQ